MSSKVFIYINSLNISFTEFETIIWNQTKLDEIKKREYLPASANNEDAPLALIKYLNLHMDPIFVINRWCTDLYDKKKNYNISTFWLRVFLNDEVSTVFPAIEDNVEFVDNIRRISPPIYSKLIKQLQNF